MTGALASLLLIAAGLSVTAPAYGQAAGSIAEQLFLEAKTLMHDGKAEAACEKFAASYHLDRSATGTLLNLALCHESIHKRATAWAEFRQVAAESAGRRQDRVTLARAHEEKLWPTLPRIKLAVSPEARVDGLRVVLDKGQPIPAEVWNSDLPVDPGKHAMEVSAPGKVAHVYEVVVADNPIPQTIEIAALADAPVEASVTGAFAAPAGAGRTVGFLLTGIGIVGIGGGLVMGFVASNNNRDAKDLCPDDACDNADTKDRASRLLKSANTTATISTVAVGVGALLAAGGVVLILTSGPKRGSGISIRPSVAGLGGAGLVLDGEM